MKNLKNIERFLISIPMVMRLFYGGKDISNPKPKDYVGRIILSLAGLLVLLILVVFILLLIF